MISDIAADNDRCRYCGRPLHRHFGGKRTRRTLREWDGGLVIGTWVDIRCSRCGDVTTIWYQADMLPTANMHRLIAQQRGRKVYFPQRKQFSCVQTL